MVGGDAPHGAALRTHHDRLRLDALGTRARAAEQRAARDTGRGDEHVVARNEIIRREHPVDVVPGLDELHALRLVTWPELALDGAAEALDRRRRDHSLRRAAH